MGSSRGRLVPCNLGRAQLPTLALSVALLVLLLVVSWRAPRAPGPLIVVVLGALVVALFSLQDHGIQVVGPVPLGLPVLAVPDVSATDLAALILPAFGITIVAHTDNVLTARAFADRSGQSVDAKAASS